MKDQNDTDILRIDVGGRSRSIARRSDLETMWEGIGVVSSADEAFSFDDDERLPYWVEVWPSALKLSEYIEGNAAELIKTASGGFCLEPGCGLGLVSIVAAQAGLKPLAMDYEPEALEFVRLNARLNDAEQTAALVMDWRTQALKSGCVSLVCAADILYERRFVQPVADFLDHVLGEDGVVLLADPMRNFLQDFDERMNSLGFESRTLSNDSVACEGYEVRIRLREHRRKSRPAT